VTDLAPVQAPYVRESILARRSDKACRHKACASESIHQWAYGALDPICYLCLADLTDEPHHLDHVRPLSRGGRHCRRNVLWTCPACNRTKGSLALAELFIGG
jgi:5-methylcytosine-specific restriction endonuclease McrA